MKRPWNRTNQNIYSLITFNESNIFNMNICTYVSVINMQPKIYAISIDYNTLTYLNLNENNNNYVLQALSTKNIDTVKVLGKKSGLNYDKKNYLTKKKLITNWGKYSILNNLSFVIELKEKKKIYKMKDHALFIFQVKKFKNFNNKLLTLNNLIEKKIVL